MEFTVYTIPLWIVAVVGTGLAALTAYYHEQKGAYELFALFIGAVFWAGGYAMEFSAAESQMKIFWYQVHFLGSAIVPTAIFVIALRFTGRDDLIRPKYIAALTVVPFITAVLIITGHNLWVVQHFMRPGKVWPLTHQFGLWYYLYAYYSLAIAVAAIGMFVQAVLERSEGSWINTTSAFLVATILPTAGTALYVIGGTTIDYGPFAFLISGLCIMAAMFYL